MFYAFFIEKPENSRFKKASYPTFHNIIFLFLLKKEWGMSVDQQINLVLPYV